jgi:hypothetical protein
MLHLLKKLFRPKHNSPFLLLKPEITERGLLTFSLVADNHAQLDELLVCIISMQHEHNTHIETSVSGLSVLVEIQYDPDIPDDTETKHLLAVIALEWKRIKQDHGQDNS